MHPRCRYLRLAESTYSKDALFPLADAAYVKCELPRGATLSFDLSMLFSRGDLINVAVLSSLSAEAGGAKSTSAKRTQSDADNDIATGCCWPRRL
jgi:hypothetical protein